MPPYHEAITLHLEKENKIMIKDRDEPIAELKLSVADLNFLIDSLEHSASRSQNKDQLELLYFLRGKKNKLISNKRKVQ